MENNELKNSINELMNVSNSNKLICKSFISISVNSKNWISSVIIFGISIVFSFWGCFQAHTVPWISSVVDTLLNVQMAIFGSILAVYAIIIAFFDKNFIRKLALLKSESTKPPMLIEYTQYYENMLCLSFLGIITSSVIILFLKLLPENWVLFPKLLIDEIIACVIISIYIFFNLRVIYELKSLIFNTIFLFRASISYQAIDILSDENDKED